MFPIYTIIAWDVNIYRIHKDIIITTLLLPIGHIFNSLGMRPPITSSAACSPPKATIPKGYAISLGGISVPPLPIDKEFDREVFRSGQEQAMWRDPKYDAYSGY
jgi:hypothetical protein